MTLRRWLVTALGVVTIATVARAAPPVVQTNFVWDAKSILLYAKPLPLRDALDNLETKKKLEQGLKVTVQVRGYVVPVAGGDPIALAARTCTIALDLWNDVYKVERDGVLQTDAVNMKGVYRRCTDHEFPVVARNVLPTTPSDYKLNVKVDVNPKDPALQKKIQQWITRPSGTTGAISPGDALFATFANVFMSKKIAQPDYALEFDTSPFPK